MKFLRSIIKHLLLIINILVVVGYLFGVASTFVPPYRMVFFSYFGLVFPLFAAANIFFVLFWAIRKKWLLFSISAALLIFTFSHLNNCFTIPYKSFGKQKTEQEIKILSYNISMLSMMRNSQTEDFFKFVAETDADIVCFQEFGYYAEKEKDGFLAKMKKNYPYSHIWYKNQSKSSSWGVATFSKFPIIFKKKIDFDSKYNVSVFSDIVINEDTIRVFNNHLESNKFSMTDIRKYQKMSFSRTDLYNVSSAMSQKLSDAYKIRAAQARIVAGEIKKSPYKNIVCGDFNDVPESYAYRTLKGNLTDLYTATSWGYRYTFYAEGMLVGIDHILIDKSFVPIKLTIPRKKFSDHYPVVGVLGIK